MSEFDPCSQHPEFFLSDKDSAELLDRKLHDLADQMVAIARASDGVAITVEDVAPKVGVDAFWVGLAVDYAKPYLVKDTGILNKHGRDHYRLASLKPKRTIRSVMARILHIRNRNKPSNIL
jgi:hypothetical protein